MNRTGLLIALVIAAVVGAVFAVWPELDTRLSSLFYDPSRSGFWLQDDPKLQLLRDAARILITLIVAPAIIALVMKLIWPGKRAFMSLRAALFLTATLALGPGILANTILKDNWGRPRPSEITSFGDEQPFRPWWDPRGGCPANCSFIAGEPSGAFWTLAPASLAPPQWRALAYGGAIAFGLGVGALRLVVGGHFASDILLGGVLMFVLIYAAHGLIYRWPRTRMTDESLETGIEQAVGKLRAAVRGGKRA